MRTYIFFSFSVCLLTPHYAFAQDDNTIISSLPPLVNSNGSMLAAEQGTAPASLALDSSAATLAAVRHGTIFNSDEASKWTREMNHVGIDLGRAAMAVMQAYDIVRDRMHFQQLQGAASLTPDEFNRWSSKVQRDGLDVGQAAFAVAMATQIWARRPNSGSKKWQRAARADSTPNALTSAGINNSSKSGLDASAAALAAVRHGTMFSSDEADEWSRQIHWADVDLASAAMAVCAAHNVLDHRLSSDGLKGSPCLTPDEYKTWSTEVKRDGLDLGEAHFATAIAIHSWAARALSDSAESSSVAKRLPGTNSNRRPPAETVNSVPNKEANSNAQRLNRWNEPQLDRTTAVRVAVRQGTSFVYDEYSEWSTQMERLGIDLGQAALAVAEAHRLLRREPKPQEKTPSIIDASDGRGGRLGHMVGSLRDDETFAPNFHQWAAEVGKLDIDLGQACFAVTIALNNWEARGGGKRRVNPIGDLPGRRALCDIENLPGLCPSTNPLVLETINVDARPGKDGRTNIDDVPLSRHHIISLRAHIDELSRRITSLTSLLFLGGLSVIGLAVYWAARLPFAKYKSAYVSFTSFFKPLRIRR